MKRITLLLTSLLLSFTLAGQQKDITNLPCRMEELTSPQFVTAAGQAGGVCVIPLGIIEKHSMHLPLGTDLFEAREAVLQAAEKEYAVVFPPYFVGQIFEARHQPGTISYSNDLIWQMLDETCRELSRNGLKKIILFNGHGGSTSFLQYFCQSQLSEKRDYIVVLFQGSADPSADKEIQALRKAAVDGHAGENETARMFYIRPELVDRQAIGTESGANQARLGQMNNGFTGIWWYARYPNHFAGDAVQPDRRLGELLIEKDASQLAGLIKYLKENDTIEQLQEEFYGKALNPAGK